MSYRRNQDDISKSRGWKDKSNHYERHYCEACNVWMASDRASILTHQNGKKHAEKVQELQVKKSLETLARDKQQAALQKSLQQMEAGAAATLQQDYYGLFAGSVGGAPTPVVAHAAAHGAQPPPIVSSHYLIPPPPPHPRVPSGVPPPPPPNKQEKKEWDERKKQRDEEKKKKRNQDDVEEETSNNKRRKVKIGEKDGHYPAFSFDQSQNTWLEGLVFGDMLEEDMPIQVWLGNASVTSDVELRLPENQRHWRDGLVAAVRRRPTAEQHADRIVVDVAYLLNGEDDADEQLKKSVPLQHIRILLGNDADDRIPSTLEEARLLAMGGEEIVLKKPKREEIDAEIEEATGLSGWSTVKIRRTTVRNELKEEREAARQKRKAATAKAERDAKEAEARRMEEAKVSNANDSALGAYDVWSRTEEGYRGVDIHSSTETTDVHEFGKKLAADGNNVGFKKSAFKGAAKKKQNRRTTSADDD